MSALHRGKDAACGRKVHESADGLFSSVLLKKRSNLWVASFVLEAPPGIEPGMKVLQTSALPLGYGADVERETGLEPATSALARRRSTK